MSNSDLESSSSAGKEDSRGFQLESYVDDKSLKKGISRRLSVNEDNDEYNETGTNAGIERIISRLSQRSGSLGPLESLIDTKNFTSNPHPSSTFNLEDYWKYPIDMDTGLRIVEFVDHDKENPRYMSKLKKWLITYSLALTCFCVSFGSSVVTGNMEGPEEEFGVSQEVVILCVSLFVIGFGVGPLISAPLSEEVGRRKVYIVTLGIAVIFIIPCALAKNIGTLLVARLIDGMAFSTPLTLIGGTLADIWATNERGIAMALFSAAPYCGPAIGPLIGGFVGANVGWRWIYWVLLIFSGCMFIMVCFIPETHHQTILKRRAKKLRQLTGDETYKTISELKIRSISTVAKEAIMRPFILLSELIVLLMTLYMSVNYGLLYMFFFAYPVVYMEGKGWSEAKTGLMFLPILVGTVLATFIAPAVNRDYIKRCEVYHERGEEPPPELRLIPMMWTCWILPAGLFAFAWTTYPRLNWAGPCISGMACGFSFCALYNPGNNYLVDSYQNYAASALASKTSVRSFWAAGVVLFTVQMYHRLGYQWATSLMGFIALACCAIPYLFYYYGASIRKHSRYAYSGIDGEE